MSATSDTPTYLHGFSATEQARLLKQARLLETTLFNQIDYSGARRLLEVGSGVGAQTEILLRRFSRAACHRRGLERDATGCGARKS